eukprot:GHVS01094424.1.p2 GENE.GHVS01094424.1~~GHVS01094424.1.p2  ORF type:complete len:154 (+),score=43.55 GHVS01094424.1:133-594(+)
MHLLLLVMFMLCLAPILLSSAADNPSTTSVTSTEDEATEWDEAAQEAEWDEAAARPKAEELTTDEKAEEAFSVTKRKQATQEAELEATRRKQTAQGLAIALAQRLQAEENEDWQRTPIDEALSMQMQAESYGQEQEAGDLEQEDEQSRNDGDQ